MDLALTGKTALVTGASRGIGAAIAHELAKEGVNLCLVARDEEKLREVAASIHATANVQTVIHAADLRMPDAGLRAVETATKAFGRLDILVNNAGATKRGDFFTLTEDDWQDGFALKFHGYVRLTRAAWPHLKRINGNIVNSCRHTIWRPIGCRVPIVSNTCPYIIYNRSICPSCIIK